MCWQFTVDFSQTGRRKICAGLLQTINKLQRHKRGGKKKKKKKRNLAEGNNSQTTAFGICRAEMHICGVSL